MEAIRHPHPFDPLRNIPKASARKVKIMALSRLLIIWLTTLLLAMLLGAAKASGQGISTSLITEKTIMGQQLGGALGYELKSGLEMGVFYQKNLDNYSEISEYGYEYTGLYLSKILFGYEDINLAPWIRAGVSDRNNVVVVPGIRMQAQLQPNLMLQVSTALRASEATLGIGIAYKITQ